MRASFINEQPLSSEIRGLIKSIIMAKINLKQYGITGTTEVIYNPSYDELYREETRKGLRGYERVR